MDIATWFALAIALGSIGWQIKDFFPRLRMSVVDLYIPYVYKNMSLVLVRLAFVNPSSRAKCVCHVDINIKSTIIPVHRAEVLAMYEKDLHTLIYALPEAQNHQFPLAVVESLQIPLDIPPHQSLSKWCVFAAEIEGDKLEPVIAIAEFRAYDYQLKVSGFRLSFPKRPMAYCWKQILAGQTTAVSWPFY